MLLPACSSIVLLLACTRAAAQTPGYDSSITRLGTKTIQPGTDKDGAQVLKRLNGIIVENKAGSGPLSTLNIFGLGERYNQVLFNGAPLPSFVTTGRAWPLEIIPTEIIEDAGAKKIGTPNTPADFAGGTISIRTKDIPEQNYFYLRADGGWSDATNGKDFYSDKRGAAEWLSFPGEIRALPASMPTSRTLSSFDQLNPQEQVAQSKLFKNNLAPVRHGAAPDERVMLGFGRVFKLKKGEQAGIIAFVNQQRSQRIDASTTQVMPDIASNVYPFADGSKPLIVSLANNTSHRLAAQLGATLNAAIVFGRNKISLKNFFSHQLNNTYTQRSQVLKPDEDSLAHTGISYLTEQTFFLNTQLSGEHGLGGDGKFKMSWQATYAYLRRQNPDERNFLLRQDPNNNSLFEIAHPQSPAYSPGSTDMNVINSNFTNSGRQWLDNKEHNFTGSIDILTPFELWGRTQALSGGVYIRTKYRVLSSDLYLTNGPGYFPLDQLLSAERYFPGGLSVQNYYANSPSNLNFIYPNNRANYQASENLGAACISLENRLPWNLSFNWGFRLESGSQLVSSIRYVYSDGFKYPQVSTLDENTNIQHTVLLPSATATWQPLRPLNIHASYFKTVNRPELQELSAYRHYDALSFMVTTGNAVLATTNVDNYDAGISYQPFAGTHFAVSGFHKRLEQPIGYILTAWSTGNLLSTPFNMPPATINGLTGDVKVKLGYFSAFASGTWLRSKVSAGAVRNLGKAREHSLNNTPDLTLNMGLVLQHPRLPMITLLYSRAGDYIIAAGSGAGYTLANGSTVLSIPDYRMKERDNMDIQVAQKIWHSRIQLIAGVNNVTNSATVIYQDLNANKQFDKPLTLAIKNNSGGYYQEGVDNTPMSIKAQRTYYFTITYLFK